MFSSMKRVVLLVLLLAETLAYGQHYETMRLTASMSEDGLYPGFGEARYSVGVSGEYAYNLTWGHYGNVNVQALLPLNEHFEMTAGVQAGFAGAYTGTVVLRPKFGLPVGEMFVDAGVLYKALTVDRQHDFCAALSVGYRFDYLSVQVGMFSRVMSSFDRDWHSEETFNSEPFNVMYRVEVFCRPQRSRWNVSACVANYDDFQMERVWQPLFMLGGRYDVTDNWRVQLAAECKLTGMFHLNAAYYGTNVRVGAEYRF